MFYIKAWMILEVLTCRERGGEGAKCWSCGVFERVSTWYMLSSSPALSLPVIVQTPPPRPRFPPDKYAYTLSHSHTFLHDRGSNPRYFNYYINLTVSAGCACCDCCERATNKWLRYPISRRLCLPLYQTQPNTHKQTIFAVLVRSLSHPFILTIQF